ncbi:hypothetical protein [Nocardia sp. NPDC058497]|uniref:hypothetical protein n=1 Tax=Nocardia sp. NPDC058497 TaxID=3346529 RepID=UPI003648C164
MVEGSLRPAATRENFERLRADPLFDDIVGMVANYLAMAFDAPASAERERWTLSCFPQTGRASGLRRMCTLNFGSMEVLYISQQLSDGVVADHLVTHYVSASALESVSGFSLSDLVIRNGRMSIERTSMVSAGGDGAVIQRWLSDPVACDQAAGIAIDARTIRPLADHLATKGRGSHQRSHNRWFAEHVLGLMAN